VTDLQFKEAPQFVGFWVEDLERPQASPSGELVTIEGESYRRFPLLRKLLFPTKAGTLALPAATFRVALVRQGFFDTGGVVERATKPLSVTVDPLPEAPGFSGAVGRFRTSATLDRDRVPLGEAAMLRFRVEGTGNLKWIDRAPEVTAKGARVFPPQAKSDLRTTADGITGSRTWSSSCRRRAAPGARAPFSWFDLRGRVGPPRRRRLTALRSRAARAPLPVPAPSGAASAEARCAPGRPDRHPAAGSWPRPGRAVALAQARPPPARGPLGSGGAPARAAGTPPRPARCAPRCGTSSAPGASR
jgi:hypothetical protein